MASPWPGARHVAALEAERLGDAQARAVEQRQHGGVAREDPRLALLAGAEVGIGDLLGRCDGERLRQRLRHLRRAHGGERADLALAVAFQKARERAHARERPHQRAAADAVAAPRRHEGAHVLRRELGEFGERRRAAEMLGHESEELPDVALVGLDGLARHAALGAEMREPARHLGRHVRAAKVNSLRGSGFVIAPAHLRARTISPPSFTLP